MRKLIIAILLLISFGSQAQIINASAPYRGMVSPCSSYLLDDYSGAAAAYSLRQLRCAYSGSSIRVRRSSDNTEQDIGFVNGELDTTSLKTFVGTGGSDDGFVVTWYDQSGSGTNVTQSTSGNQPFIMDNGIVQRQGAKPAILFVAASSNYLDGGDILDLSELYLNAFATVKLSSAVTGTSFGKSRAASTAGRWSFLKDANSLYLVFVDQANTTRNASVGYTNTDYSLFETYINKSSDSTQLKKNNAQIAVNTAAIDDGASNTTDKFYIGVYQNATGSAPLAGYYLNGNIGEIIIYRSLWNSTERTGIVTNINTYYSIY